jgi:hypothetical protein
LSKRSPFAGPDDAEIEGVGETGAPEHDEEGVDDVTSVMMVGESKGYCGKKYELVPPAKSGTLKC